MNSHAEQSSWFTVETVDDSTFAISEYKHWEEAHCYLACGTDKAALIDTGLGVGDITSVVDSLTDLPVTVLTTHAHWDHIGGHASFEEIAVHELDAPWLTSGFPLSLETVQAELVKEPCAFPETFSLENYEIYQGTPRMILHDGDVIDLGNRALQVIHTPGHSPGHCCFYEPERKYLYTGDLIYRGCLDAFYPSTDPVAFSKSVQKVQRLGVERLLPGHHHLDIPVSLVDDVEEGFRKLEDDGLLAQGSGLFDFGEFRIHL